MRNTEEVQMTTILPQVMVFEDGNRTEIMVSESPEAPSTFVSLVVYSDNEAIVKKVRHMMKGPDKKEMAELMVELFDAVHSDV